MSEKENNPGNSLPEEEKSTEWKARENAQNSSMEGVYSIKTHREVNPDAPRGIVSEQKKDFENFRVKEPEEKAEEAALSEGALVPTEINLAQESSPEFEKAKAEWSAARASARKLEEEYRTKYKAHVLEQSKGLRSLANLPRRMFGFQPGLTPELEALEGASLIARRNHKEAGKALKEIKEREGNIRQSTDSTKDAAKRYERMLARHLVVGTQRRRLEAQQDAVREAWGVSKIKPVMEALNKYKYARIGVTALGYGVLAGATGGLAAAAYGGGAYLSRIAVAMGLGAGVGLGGQTFYVEKARKRLEEAKEEVGDDFFQNDFMTDDQEMKQLTFEVSARQARVRTAAMVAGLSASLLDNEPGTGGVDTGDNLPSAPESSGVESTTPETSIDNNVGEPTGSLSETETGTASEVNDTDASFGRAGGDTDSLTRSSGSGVSRVPTIDRNPDTTTAPDVEVKPKDYSLPPFSSVNDLPSQGIIESVPQAPVESPVVSQDPNLTPMTESEATATFGPVTGPSVEGLIAPEQITYTVEKGDNVWNIMEGKGPDANPIGGKSEVLEGMNSLDRQAALDKLVEYAEQNPEFAKEIGAVKSGGDIHRIYPGEEVNVSMLDDKLRELIGNDHQSIPEVSAPAEAGVASEIKSEVPHSAQAPEPTPIASSSPALEQVEYGSADTATVAPEASVPVVESPKISAAVNGYVSEVEKSSGFIFNKPAVTGTFEALKGLSIGEFKAMAANDNLSALLEERGVSFDGFERWGETLQKQVGLIPANDTETIGGYVTRIASANIRAA